MMKIFTSKKQNLEALASSLLNSLQVKVTKKTVKTCLNEHPQYPSILALSDCLHEWNVANRTYKIKKGDYDVSDLLFPFAAHFSEQEGRFILVHRIESGKVLYTDEEHSNEIMNEQDFLDRWDGIALYGEKNARSGQNEFQKHNWQHFLRIMLLPASVILCVLILAMVISSYPFSASYLTLLLIKLVGFGAATLLLFHSINSQNPLIQNLCSLGGKNDCNAILKSNSAQLTSWLSWSEIGFFYFSGSFLSMLLNPSSVSLLAWLGLLTVPYTVYSISYQFRKKKWCSLCCMIQAILWFEFLANIGYSTFSLPIVADRLNWIIICFLTPIINQAMQLAPLTRQLKKFKYNNNLFRQILTNQPRYSVDANLMPVVFGNPEGTNVITMVSNPYCSPCAKAHAFLENWVAGRDDVQVKVIFVTAEHEDDIRNKVAGHLSALTLCHDKKIAGRALSQWYGQKGDFESWAANFPIEKSVSIYDANVQQKQWCKMAEITFTPTILINGYKMPDPYQLEDLRYLLN